MKLLLAFLVAVSIFQHLEKCFVSGQNGNLFTFGGTANTQPTSTFSNVGNVGTSLFNPGATLPSAQTGFNGGISNLNAGLTSSVTGDLNAGINGGLTSFPSGTVGSTLNSGLTFPADALGNNLNNGLTSFPSGTLDSSFVNGDITSFQPAGVASNLNDGLTSSVNGDLTSALGYQTLASSLALGSLAGLGVLSPYSQLLGGVGLPLVGVPAVGAAAGGGHTTHQESPTMLTCQNVNEDFQMAVTIEENNAQHHHGHGVFPFAHGTLQGNNPALSMDLSMHVSTTETVSAKVVFTERAGDVSHGCSAENLGNVFTGEPTVGFGLLDTSVFGNAGPQNDGEVTSVSLHPGRQSSVHVNRLDINQLQELAGKGMAAVSSVTTDRYGNSQIDGDILACCALGYDNQHRTLPASVTYSPSADSSANHLTDTDPLLDHEPHILGLTPVENPHLQSSHYQSDSDPVQTVIGGTYLPSTTEPTVGESDSTTQPVVIILGIGETPPNPAADTVGNDDPNHHVQQTVGINEYPNHHGQQTVGINEYPNHHVEHTVGINEYPNHHVEQAVGTTGDDQSTPQPLVIVLDIGATPPNPAEGTVSNDDLNHVQQTVAINGYPNHHGEQTVAINGHPNHHGEQTVAINEYPNHHGEQTVAISGYPNHRGEQTVAINGHPNHHGEQTVAINEYPNHHGEQTVAINGYPNHHGEQSVDINPNHHVDPNENLNNHGQHEHSENQGHHVDSSPGHNEYPNHHVEHSVRHTEYLNEHLSPHARNTGDPNGYPAEPFVGHDGYPTFFDQNHHPPAAAGYVGHLSDRIAGKFGGYGPRTYPGPQAPGPGGYPHYPPPPPPHPGRRGQHYYPPPPNDGFFTPPVGAADNPVPESNHDNHLREKFFSHAFGF